MSLLLDTHALFWWVTNSPSLSERARAAILGEEGPCHVGAASVFELSNKVRLGKFEAAKELVERLEYLMVEQAFTPLSVSHAHARLAGRLAAPHRDPFDRILAAQSIIEDCPVVTVDPASAALGAKVLW